MHAARTWHARGVDVVCTQYARGMFWYTRGIHVVSTWYACGMHLVHMWYAHGMHGICMWYARGLHAACTRYARGMHVICARCAHTFDTSIRTFSHVPCSICARASVKKMPVWCMRPNKAPSAPTPNECDNLIGRMAFGDVVPVGVHKWPSRKMGPCRF